MYHGIFSNSKLQREFEKWIKFDPNNVIMDDFLSRFYGSLAELSIRVQKNEDLDRLFSYYCNPRLLMKTYSDLCISACRIDRDEDKELVNKLVEEAVLKLYYDSPIYTTLLAITNRLIASKPYDPVYMKIRRFNDELLTIYICC
jgi:hypothetical protein